VAGPPGADDRVAEGQIFNMPFFVIGQTLQEHSFVVYTEMQWIRKGVELERGDFQKYRIII
jgi:hypothetical protein